MEFHSQIKDLQGGPDLVTMESRALNGRGVF
jgi:hypothetical protein